MTNYESERINRQARDHAIRAGKSVPVVVQHLPKSPGLRQSHCGATEGGLGTPPYGCYPCISAYENPTVPLAHIAST